MAKVKGAFGSFGVSGTVGKVYTFGKWKGVQYAREHVVPANPRTATQTTQRNHFQLGVDTWHSTDLTSYDKLAYSRAAQLDPKPMSGFNWFMSWFRKYGPTNDWPLLYGINWAADPAGIKFGITCDRDGPVRLECIRGPQAGYTENLVLGADVFQWFAGVDLDDSSVFLFLAGALGFQSISGVLKAKLPAV